MPTPAYTSGLNVKKAEGKGWIPIAHRDGASNDIFLHFPHTGKKVKKRDRLTDAFPKVIIGDFGYVNQLDDPEERSSHGLLGIVQFSQWEDVALFGKTVRQLMYCAIDIEYGSGINESYRLKTTSLEKNHSDDLIAALTPFRKPPGQRS